MENLECEKCGDIFYPEYDGQNKCEYCSGSHKVVRREHSNDLGEVKFLEYTETEV